MSQIDIAVVGAGIAGLVCAQILQQAGYRVVVVEKSRGVGGRLATRRLYDTRADHGTCFVAPKQAVFRDYIDFLLAQDVVRVWTQQVHTLTPSGRLQEPDPTACSPRYVAPDGMNAIAKALAPGLDIRFNQRVLALHPLADQAWRLSLNQEQATADSPATPSTLEAKAVILTLPAPQALDLLTPLENTVIGADSCNQLRSVQFHPCIAVMAGYTAANLQAWQAQYPTVKAIAPQGLDLAWIGLDSSKRREPTQPVMVFQSTAAFAEAHLETADLKPVGDRLLHLAAAVLPSWLATPAWMQVHRWRYALVAQPLPQPFVAVEAPVPLMCAGDWCGGMRVESAFLSGIEAATALNRLVHDRPLRSPQFWQTLATA